MRSARRSRSPLGEVAAVFLRLGATAFGGPAAHVAMMHRELVERRRWQDEQQFLDLVGLTALLPGPNSTELAIELGRRRAGRAGLVVAGLAFIAPAAVLVGGVAWAYDRYRTTSLVDDLRTGILPVVVAIIAFATFKLGRTAVRDVPTALIAVAALVLFLLDVHELVLLAGGSAVTFLWWQRHRLPPPAALLSALLTLPFAAAGMVRGGTGAADGGRSDLSLVRLGLTFLRIGATMFGSGYVLVAFLDAELVERLAVLSERELLDAVAIGQVTPGPLFTTATFVGYLVAGVAGAVVASVGIFLPAFVLVAVLGPRLEDLLQRPAARALLDGLNAAAVGLVGGAAVDVANVAIHGWSTGLLAAVALALLATTRLNPSWLVLGGVGVGLAAAGLG